MIDAAAGALRMGSTCIALELGTATPTQTMLLELADEREMIIGKQWEQ